jgi:predicted ATP-dependent serine protease
MSEEVKNPKRISTFLYKNRIQRVVYIVSQLCKLNISKRDVKNVSETS